MALLKDGPLFYTSPEGLKTAVWHSGRARELERMGWTRVGSEYESDAFEAPEDETPSDPVAIPEAPEPDELSVEVTEPAVIEEPSQEVEIPDFEGMLKYELVEYCNSHNIELPENATKAKILEIIADPHRTYRHYE